MSFSVCVYFSFAKPLSIPFLFWAHPTNPPGEYYIFRESEKRTPRLSLLTPDLFRHDGLDPPRPFLLALTSDPGPLAGGSMPVSFSAISGLVNPRTAFLPLSSPRAVVLGLLWLARSAVAFFSLFVMPVFLCAPTLPRRGWGQSIMDFSFSLPIPLPGGLDWCVFFPDALWSPLLCFVLTHYRFLTLWIHLSLVSPI